MKTIGYWLLSVLTAGWLWAMYGTLSEGHEVLNTTQHVPWGLWVAFYIFFLGLSAGAFLLSSLVYVFGVKRLEPAGPTALVQALGCLLLGGFLIVVDLGHPERGYKVLTHWNPSSVMAWMGVFYIIYVSIIVAELYLALRPSLIRRGRSSSLHRLLSLRSTDLSPQSIARDHRWLKVLGIIGIPIALGVHGGVGSIFAVAKARPSWFSGLFPIIFIVSALASGGALLTFLVAAFGEMRREAKLEVVRTLALLSFAILIFDLLLVGSEVLVTKYGNVPHEVEAWNLTLFGPYWWLFWVVQIGIGLVVPLLILANRARRSSIAALGLAGHAMVIGILGARLILVIPAQIQPTFSALPEAYHHPRFAYGYLPSAVEWWLALGTIAVGTWIFLAARKVLLVENTV